MFIDNHPEAVRRMYQSDEALRIRTDTYARYAVPQISFPEWALGCVRAWRGDESILDVGCGPGRWYEAVQEHLPESTYLGLDLFPAMLREHPAPQRVTVADAEKLPFPEQSFDVVMANHMLFHVPNVELSLREFRRVLKPDGFVMATTNSIHTMPELQALLRRAVTLLVPPGVSHVHPPAQHADRFTLESGTRLMARHFYAVVRYDLPRILVFPTVDPVLAYLESTRPVRESELPRGVAWEDVMTVVREQVNRLIEHFGELVVNVLSGVLVATDRGDFIHEFMEQQTRSQSG